MVTGKGQDQIPQKAKTIIKLIVICFQCSRPCGEGYSRAAYACYLHSQIISPNFCLNSARPVVERKCDLPPCQWTLGSYTCDQCGVNTTRKLECIVSGTGQVTEDEHCGDQLKPSAHLYCGDCVLPENAKLVADEARINAASSTALRLTVDYGEWVYGEYSGVREWIFNC